MSEPSDGTAVPVLWDGLEDANIAFVNQMIVQLGPPGHEDEFIVTHGQLHPPVLLGSEVEKRARLESLPFVTVKVVSKIGIPVGRVRELRDLLDNMLRTYDEATTQRT